MDDLIFLFYQLLRESLPYILPLIFLVGTTSHLIYEEWEYKRVTRSTE